MTEGKFLTRAAFAAVMGVDKAQPTRWAAMGMPTRADGLVDAAEAAAWVRRHIDPVQRQTRSIGATAEHNAESRRVNEAADEFARLGVWLMAQAVPNLVARLAVDAGLDLDQARSLHDLALSMAADKANRIREWMGLPPGETGPFRRMDHVAQLTDWKALERAAAERAAGRPVDA